jgi:hypothetical protein
LSIDSGSVSGFYLGDVFHGIGYYLMPHCTGFARISSGPTRSVCNIVPHNTTSFRVYLQTNDVFIQSTNFQISTDNNVSYNFSLLIKTP